MDNKKGTIVMQKYELGRLLGEGAFAKVYHARHVATGEAYAIKVFHKDKVLRGGAATTEQIKREVSVMRRVQHPNIVRLHEVMATKSRIYFAMEYVDGGELFSKVSSLGRLREDDAHRYFRQLVEAVDFCHSRGVYHRDLKLENLLLDQNGNLKVSDFGLSALGDSRRTDGLLHTTCGTPAYVAPEVLSRRGYDGAKADIWSCGVILYVLLAGFLPFNDSNLVVLYQKIMKGEFKCPQWFPPEVKRLLARILDPSPSSRITISAVLSNPWVRRGLFKQQQQQPPAAEPPQHRLAEEAENEVARAFGVDQDLKCASLNAFDIISRAPGFDLSGLFEGERGHKRPQEHLRASFTTKKSATEIVSKLEEIAKLERRFKVRKTDGGTVKLQGYKEGRKGHVAIDAEIFQVTPNFHMVEMKKSAGDTWECHNFYNQELKPKLKDIVWSWQLGGDHQQGHQSSLPSPSSSSSQEEDTKPLLLPQPRSA